MEYKLTWIITREQELNNSKLTNGIYQYKIRIKSIKNNEYISSIEKSYAISKYESILISIIMECLREIYGIQTFRVSYGDDLFNFLNNT